MPVSKKRKVSAAVNQQEGTSIEETSLVAAVVEKLQDPTASDEPQPQIGTETTNSPSAAQAAAQNEERQERFKALQARAVRQFFHLLSLNSVHWL